MRTGLEHELHASLLHDIREGPPLETDAVSSPLRPLELTPCLRNDECAVLRREERAVRRISRMQWIWARKNDVHGESVVDCPLYTHSPSCLRAAPAPLLPGMYSLTISRHPTPTPKARQSGLGAGGASVDSAIAEREKR
ncbi:hypothetical protein C8J57DRAFT_1503395 [Mycena rebaudengoi]|nr:hypothetical protein C8J57DRAFT_1503395 [Mycena rebaudengoi]